MYPNNTDKFNHFFDTFEKKQRKTSTFFYFWRII